MTQPPELTLLPTSPFAAFPLAVQSEILAEASATFRQQNGGVRIRLVEPGFQAAAQASLIAGNGPDVLSDWIMSGYVSAGLLVDLAPLVKRDNVALGNFLSGQLDYYRQAAQSSPTNPLGLYGLPAYVNTIVYVVNQGILDEIGLSYPAPQWTWREWTRMWQASTAKGSGRRPPRSGGWVDWRGYDHSYNMPSPWVFHGWGGGYVDPSDSSRAFLGAPQTIRCGQWAYDLIWTGVCNGSPNFAGGLVVSFVHQSGSMVTPATKFRALKWDFFAPPIWPVRQTSYTSTDFVAIWAGTREPELAWQLLQWLTTGPEWQRALMKAGLISPNQPRLWSEWKATVAAAAPPLARKNLQVFVDQVQGQVPYGGNLFKRASGTAKKVLAASAPKLRQERIRVAAAFPQLARQIDAVETVAAAHGRSAAHVPLRGSPVAPRKQVD